MGNVIMKRVIGVSSSGIAKPLDLPITISLTQPTPVRAGHLWIKADIASQINNITVDKALKAGVANGTIQLIVPLDPHKLNVSQNISITTSKEVPIVINTTYAASKWGLSNVSDSGNIIQLFLDSYPLVYSTLNGVLDVETAYVWDGTTWVACSQKGAYYTNCRNGVYNFNTNYTVTLNKGDFVLPPNTNSTYYFKGLVMNSIGTVIFNTFNGDIYKRNGDIFTFYQNLGIGSWCGACKISDDGTILVLCTATYAKIYKDTGTSFTLLNSITLGGASYYTDYTYNTPRNVAINEDCTRIYVRELATDLKSMRISVIYKKPDGTYAHGGYTGQFTTVNAFSGNKTIMYARGYNLYICHTSDSSAYYVYMSDCSNMASLPYLSYYLTTYSVIGSINYEPYIYVTRDMKYMFLSCMYSSEKSVIQVRHINT